MIASALGFGGTIGRLRYFLLTTALALATAIVTMILIFSLAPRYADQVRTSGEVPGGLVLSVGVIVLPIFLWASTAFATKRFRDIGWKPLYVIPGWALAICLDTAVALFVPALAVEDGSQTAFGVGINLLMVGVLLLWPGRDPDNRVIHEPPPSRLDSVNVAPVLQRPSTLQPRPTTSTDPKVFGRRRGITI